jgi:hypothetical protein
MYRSNRGRCIAINYQYFIIKTCTHATCIPFTVSEYARGRKCLPIHIMHSFTMDCNDRNLVWRDRNGLPNISVLVVRLVPIEGVFCDWLTCFWKSVSQPRILWFSLLSGAPFVTFLKQSRLTESDRRCDPIFASHVIFYIDGKHHENHHSTIERINCQCNY